MAWLPNPIICDVCGVQKQPSNHWHYAEIRPYSAAEENPCFLLWPWDYPAEDRSKPYKHICGQACAIRLLNEFMGGSGNPPEPVPAIKPDPPAPHSDWERVKKSVRESVADAALKSTLAALPTE
jgi:hypothetical protein